MVDPLTSVRDLGIYIDADLSRPMRIHAQRSVSQCFALLRQLRIRKPVPPATFQTRFRSVATGLRQWPAGRPACLSREPTPVGTECVFTDDLSARSLRPHH